MTYTSTTFDPNQAGSYRLFARIGVEENRLAVIDQEQRLVCLSSYHPAHGTGEVDDVLNLAFGEVRAAVDDGVYVFIPEDVFDDAYLGDYMRYLPDDGLQQALVSDAPAFGVKIVHQPNRLGLEPLMERFPQLTIYPSVQAAAAGFAQYAKQNAATFLVMDKHDTRFHVSFFDSGKFVYSNDFEVYHIDDFNYYLLNILQQVGWEDERLPMQLAGDIVAGDPVHERIMKYGDPVWADTAAHTGITLPEELLLEQHQFFTLLSLNVCE